MSLAEVVNRWYKTCCSYIYSYRAHKTFSEEFIKFKEMTGVEGRFRIAWEERHPCFNDKTTQTGFDRHYVYHPAWAARVLAQTKPKCHIDISSSVNFCSQVSAFIPVMFYDYRPADLNLPGLTCEAADLLALPFADRSISSLSCMHVVEHVGLGRYGDPLDPDGDMKAIVELKRVLAINGNLLFVVPVGGNPRIMFNAHRIYTYAQIAEYFSNLELMEFALVTDDPKDGGLLRNASKEMADAQKYGCGCFWFRKVRT
ncbi:DUF268 domain-containing protein [Geomobilimonas luticola]|uniref:DUF268 domain-containing protein n=1 Tax=Geomobilimonas luticola TaxID=1114878 RepID=A0ABS5SEI4_9BACT|nr:DUF268 domain-containing protein [Geomobilimonas luticola]MBT0653026.1 DUF268 domain-containing protein [Geomobilimonas luticola]